MIPGIVLKIFFIFFSVFVAASDIKNGKVPRVAFVFAFPFFIILRFFLDERFPTWEPVAGCFAGLVIFLLAFFISGKKLGLADVWYSALIGLILGFWWWYAAIAIACITAVVYIGVLKKRRIPFIPFMALGSIAISIIQG